MAEPTIATFAELAGIGFSFTDVFGHAQQVPEEVIRQLLVALGYDPAAEDSFARLKNLREVPLPPVAVLNEGQPWRWRLPEVKSAELRHENGEITKLEIRRGRVEIPPLTMGYYQLNIVSAAGTSSCQLLVAPEKAWQPDAFSAEKRIWGIAAQLYALRGDNMGIGDFSDLRQLIRIGAKHGAGVIGLNPMHAAFPSNPAHCSPYSPSSRLFLNPIYLDLHGMEGFDRAENPYHEEAFQQKLRAARDGDLVNYPLVWELKRAVLAYLFTQRGESQAFADYCHAQGPWLSQQALFDALAEQYGSNWCDWPENYHAPDSPAILQFAAAHAERLEFYRWLYWQADTQCAEAQALAQKSGMEIGLYRDLAVGPDKGGAEVWALQSQFIAGVSVGAPPDELNPSGQNWGLPPLDPFALRETGYAAFIRLLRANMRHARALRIDHAFGLSRLYLIPDGATCGAYLHYPFAELLAILKIESHRNQCLVIGEDLGTFPSGYQEQADAAGIYSYKVFFFERDADGFIPPSRYPQRALATLSTHDLPTLAAWESYEDIEERNRLKLYPTPELMQRERENRARDKQQLLQALTKEGLNDRPNFEAIECYLARSPASLAMLQLEDLLGFAPSANVPCTTCERPNWQIRLPANINTIGEKLSAISAMLNAARARPLRDVPLATYRLQFHKDFTFRDAAGIVPYLKHLGVSHVYASPYFAARPGSMHGYDMIDHQALNPELGGEEGFREFCAALQQHGLKQLLDFVPNHMGIGGSDNRWWLATLEWGNKAPQAAYFDIDWTPHYPGAPIKLLLPMLGNHYGDVLDAGEIDLRFDRAEGSFSAWYFTHRFPICPRDYQCIASGIAQTPETIEEGEALKLTLAAASDRHAEFEAAAAAISKDHAALHALLERQFYRLAFWRVASSDINYRRFFDINELAGLRVEDKTVFDSIHARALALVADGTIHGLRIDHIDGLADPEEYLQRVRQAGGASLYLIVEKILGSGETLPESWPCDGTSGYDAMNHLVRLFVAPRNAKRFTRIYRRFAEDPVNFAQRVRRAKAMILETSLASEWRMLAQSARRLAASDSYARDYPYETLKTALSDIIAHYPVYRAYGTPRGLSTADQTRIRDTIAQAKRHTALADDSVYDYLGGLLDGSSGEWDAEHRHFLRRFQQVSGPVMAKGLEDTSFYRYARLLALNEVGGDPGRFGTSIAEFHRVQRVAQPHSMIATATHDTKRGEDARMRLAALSENPRDWLHMLLQFRRAAKKLLQEEEGETIPHPALAYFIYQTLLASWPLELMESQDEPVLDAYKQRLNAYLVKALREGKKHSSWNHPNEAYEQYVQSFTDGLLRAPFLTQFVPHAARLAKAGAVNSLLQTVLKCTLPGVPDIYQGTEYWDFSFVDPDNRRPVDYAARSASLNAASPLSELFTHWQDGQVKQHLLHRLLRHRAEFAALYRDGTYHPLRVEGAHRPHILAFARRWKNQEVVVCVPVRMAQIIAAQWPLSAEFWGDTAIHYDLAGWCNILSDEVVDSSQCGQLFRAFPAAILMRF